MTKLTPTQRAAAARGRTAATDTPAPLLRGPRPLRRAARSPEHFAPLADSPVSERVAEHARLEATYRASIEAVREHTATERAARAADAAVMADAVRRGSEDDPGMPHHDAWRVELARLERRETGARGALADAFSDLIDAVADHADVIVSANTAAAEKERTRLSKALVTAAEAVAAIDRLSATTRLAEEVAENGEHVKPRPLGRVPRVHDALTATDALAAVARTYGTD